MNILSLGGFFLAFWGCLLGKYGCNFILILLRHNPQNPKNLIIRNLANLSQPWNLTFFEHVAGIFQNIGLLQLRVAGIFETIGLFQLRLPAVWGHWYKNCHYDSLWEWWVFLRPQGCSNWGCPPFEVIGLTIVTVILFQSGGYFWDHRIAPTEAARRLRELDYQLSL